MRNRRVHPILAVSVFLLLLGSSLRSLGCAMTSDTGSDLNPTSTTAALSTVPTKSSLDSVQPRSSSTTASTSTNPVAGIPDPLQAIVGVDDTLLWRVTSKGVQTIDIGVNHAAMTGDRGWTVVYSRLDEGELYVWRPEQSSTQGAVRLKVGSGGRFDVTHMALSPDEWHLAVVGYEPTGESPTGKQSKGYLVDLETKQAETWDSLDAVRSGEEITAFHWDKGSRAIYLSFGPPGGSLGERTYQYDMSARSFTELQGLATAFDAGLQGQVLGLALETPYEHTEDGAVTGSRPLALWEDGQLTTLPRDPRLGAWSFGWLSDDGQTIIVFGRTTRGDRTLPCLEVLKLGEAGWKVDYLFIDDSLVLLSGLAFEPNSSVFWFQAGSSPDQAGLLTSVDLYQFDTKTGLVQRSLVLPGTPQSTLAVGLGFSACRGGT